MPPSSNSDSSSPNNSIAQNRSKLKDFLASIATIRGDLSNITAPPFVLDDKSTVELPAFWAERPAVFVAQAAPADPARRALNVLRNFLSSLRNQQYAGREPTEGVKKPLNAFLGEVFVCWWEDGDGDGDGDGEKVGTTRMVGEQVSHHPPVTACRVWNEAHGVYAEGFTRQEVTLSSTGVNVAQSGYAVLRLSRWGDESYLIPLPDVKVKGILTGTPYPDISGTYYIPSTSGYVSKIEFASKGLLSGLSLSSSSDKKHSFEATVYRQGQERDPLYTVSGHWDSAFTVRDVRAGEDIETFDVAHSKTAAPQVPPLEEQDPFETRRAWRGVREALARGDMQGVSDAKNVVEEGQRAMRREEEREGRTWERLFFRDVQSDEVAVKLKKMIGEGFDKRETVGVWKFDEDRWREGIGGRPWRGGLGPDNRNHGGVREREEGAAQQQQQQQQPSKRTDQPSAQMEKQPTGGTLDSLTDPETDRRTSATAWNVPAAAANADADRSSTPEAPSTAAPTTQTAKKSRDGQDGGAGRGSTRVHPPVDESVQRGENGDAELGAGVDGMSLGEQRAVEAMLRERYATGS